MDIALISFTCHLQRYTRRHCLWMPLQTFGLTLCILHFSWHNHDKKHVDNASTNIIKFISKFKLYSHSSLVSFPFTTCFIPIHHCSHSQSPLFSFPFTTVLIPSHHYSHSHSALVLLLFTTLIPIYHSYSLLSLV